MTSRYACPKTTWGNCLKSQGLAGGDFCATRLPILTTFYRLGAKIPKIFE